MKQNLNKLWSDVFDDDVKCPSIDPKNIQKRVDSSLNASASTKKLYVRRRLCIAAVCTALLVVLAGTALAVHYKNTVLSAFHGDTTLIEPAIQIVEEEMAQSSYKVTVDSILCDTNNIILGLTIEGLTEEAAASLSGKASLLHTLYKILRFETEGSNTKSSVLPHQITPVERTNTTLSCIIYFQCIDSPNTLYLYLVDGTENDTIILSLDKTLTSLSVIPEPVSENTDYFIRSCDLNATRLILEVEFAHPVKGDRIVEFYFRMVDGSLKTLSQLCGHVASHSEINLISNTTEYIYRYTFLFDPLIDPLSILGIVVNGTEYSFLDPEYAVPTEVPPTMRPFLTPYMFINNVFYFSAQDVCDHLGAALDESNGQYTIRYLDTVLTFTLDSTFIILNGEPTNVEHSPQYQNGDLILPVNFFVLLGVTHEAYYPDLPSGAPEYWLVTP